MTLNRNLSPLFIVPNEPVTLFSYCDGNKLTVPTVTPLNTLGPIDFSISIVEPPISETEVLKDNLFIFQDTEEDPSKGLKGTETSAVSAPVATGVKAEHNTIDLPYA